MKTYLEIPVISLFLFLFAFALSTSLQAQSTDKKSEKEPSATEHHELIKYEKTYTLEQEKSDEAFASTVSGIERRSPDPVFLAANIVTTDPSQLKEAKADEPAEEQEDYQYAYSGTFQSNDVSFIEGSDGSNGSSAGCSSGLVNINY